VRKKLSSSIQVAVISPSNSVQLFCTLRTAAWKEASLVSKSVRERGPTSVRMAMTQTKRCSARSGLFFIWM